MAVKRIEYGLILFGLFIFHLFFADYLSFYLFLFFLVIPAVSLLLTLVSRPKVQAWIEAFDGKTVGKGEEFPVRIYLKNASLFGGTRVRVRLTVKNELLGTKKKETLIFVMGKAGQTASYRVASEYCGRISCRITQVKSFDFLWLFAFKGKCRNGETAVTVLPGRKALPVSVGSEKDGDWDSDEYSPVKPGDDPGEVFDIREYREGDRISRIHWKLSSKRSELMIKEGGFPVRRRIFLVLDLSGAKGEEMLADTLTELFFSVSCFLVENGIAHKSGWWRKMGNGGHFVTENVEGEESFYQVFGEILAAGRPEDSRQVIDGCLEAKKETEILYFCTGLSRKEAELLCSGIFRERICIFQMKSEAKTERAGNRGREEDPADGRKTAESLGAEWKILSRGKEWEELQDFEI